MESEKPTQGSQKMERYIEELVRNQPFQTLLEKLRKRGEKWKKGRYPEWSPEEQQEHDRFGKEISEIIDGYEKLRVRAEKLLDLEGMDTERTIAEEYALDRDQIFYAQSLYEREHVELFKMRAELDMCKTESLYDEDMFPLNPGEEIIYLNPSRQLSRFAYPVAVTINARASKRDVIDYVEKRWKWIESKLREDPDEKEMRLRKRKHDLKIIDFLWDNQKLPSKELKQRLDTSFPNNGIAYFEINKLLSLERKRRHRE